MMGHDSPAATAIYTHMSAEHKRPALEKVVRHIERVLSH